MAVEDQTVPPASGKALARALAVTHVEPVVEPVETSSPVETSKPEVLAARCPGCTYTYEVEAGDEHEGFAAGTAWADIPDDWCCPDCGVREKVDFVPVERIGA